MRATGIVRRIDDLGRVVIPKEIRRTVGIREGDALEIFLDRDGNVIFRPYSVIEGMVSRSIYRAMCGANISGFVMDDKNNVVGGRRAIKLPSDFDVMELNSPTSVADNWTATPIKFEGDTVGAVVFYNGKPASISIVQGIVAMASAAMDV